MNKKKIIIMGAVISVIIIAVIYLGVAVYYQYHFLPGTTINGTDYSNETIDSVKENYSGRYKNLLSKNN